jgi:hypothetical protein
MRFNEATKKRMKTITSAFGCMTLIYIGNY